MSNLKAEPAMSAFLENACIESEGKMFGPDPLGMQFWGMQRGCSLMQRFGHIMARMEPRYL
jgi:hypothetical protein